MTFLDMRTITFNYVLVEIICLIVAIILWRQSRNRFAGTQFWVFDFIMQTLGLFLITIRGVVPDSISVVLANALIMTGAFLSYAGLLKFVGKKSTQVHNYLFLALLTLIHSYFTFVKPDVVARGLNISVGLSIFTFQRMWLALYGVPAAIRRSVRYVGIVCGAFSLIGVFRIVEFFMRAGSGNDFFRLGILDSLVVISYMLLTVLLTYTLVLMVNERLLDDIRTEEEKFSKAFRSSPYAIILSRLSDGLIIEVNDGFVKSSGYTLTEIKNRTTAELHLWARDEDRAIVLDEVSKNGRMQGREFQFRTRSGEILWGIYSAEIVAIKNEKCILSSINDITVRKETENALLESEALVRAVMDNLPIGIAVNSVDPAVIFSYVNDNFIKFYRITRETITGPDDFWNAVYEEPEFREAMKKRVLGDCASGDPERMYWKDIPISRKGEETTFVSARNIPLPARKLMISTVWDVTEERKVQKEIWRLNEELEKKVSGQTGELRKTQLALLNLVDDLNESTKNVASTNKSLEAVNKELAAFSYSVSHDLRAPLRAIDGFSQAIIEDYADKPLDETGRTYLEKIRRGTQNMGQLIDDMLNLSRVTQSEFVVEQIDLSKMVRSIIAEYQESKPEKQVTVNIQEDVTIRGDHRLIRIVFINLLGNAWKFAGKREDPHIEFGMTQKDGLKTIYVRDNGVGFDMAYAGKLFGAFQRLHRTDEFPGTGIGLATVQRIIHRHGGHVWAEGEIGKGATFFFTLEA
jgi:PAS domain S-box-containing protein